MPLVPAKHVLLLSPGSKVALTRALADAIAGRNGRLTGWESDPYSPAAAWCHALTPGGAVETDSALEQLLGWSQDNGVQLIVPSRHDDLPTLARARDRFAEAGITIVVSSGDTIDICHDKAATHAWLAARGMPVPEQATLGEWNTHAPAARFPLVAKDPRGSGSRSVRLCRSAGDLADLPGSWILQSFAPGTEYTINTYVARDGRCLTEIPHERILTSEGEVVRGRTARVPVLMDLARRISESLPGARGPLNIQIFWEVESGRATVIEINPRFGGGYPLAHEAGGRFAEWLVDEYVDGRELHRLEAWTENLTMVRYREAAFFPPKNRSQRTH